MRILDFSNHDDAVQTSYAVDVSQGVEHEVLIGFHIAGIYLDQEVIIAGGVVDSVIWSMVCTVSMNC